MSNRTVLNRALEELRGNREQSDAAQEKGHCVVLAGPGSGKTKTLTTAMARALEEDVLEPRGVACVTYNTECAMELEARLQRLGITPGGRAFVGTVHGFALSQVIGPYARRVRADIPSNFRIATKAEEDAAVEAGYRSAINGPENPHSRWKFATEKRRRHVDRTRPEWRGQNPDLAAFIEAYEAELRRRGLIDFEDMPLVAYRMAREHAWIRDAIRARFPALFVDEYQDLGYALHELVMLLCFGAGVRLFAVGDADQSIYGFQGANSDLLEGLTERADVTTIRLRFNYRSGAKIIRASLGALGEDRDYRAVDGAPQADITFSAVPYDLDGQAASIASEVVPGLTSKGIALNEIAVLYKTGWLGDKVETAFKTAGVPSVRSDPRALVRRSSRLSRLVEGCARWITGGWRDADPPYARLLSQAQSMVFGQPPPAEAQDFSVQFMQFLNGSIGTTESAHLWLQRISREVIEPWRAMARLPDRDWEACDEMIRKTDPAHGLDLSLNHFAGRVDGTGRVNLTTLHSAKGREFDAVILYGINESELPDNRDRRSQSSLREARRLFYVGVTRPRKHLCLVFQEKRNSPWVYELYQRVEGG